MVAQQSEGRAGPRPGQGITTFSVSPRHRSALVVVALAQRRGIIVVVEGYFSYSPSIFQAAPQKKRGREEKKEKRKEKRRKNREKKKRLSKSLKVDCIGAPLLGQQKAFLTLDAVKWSLGPRQFGNYMCSTNSIKPCGRTASQLHINGNGKRCVYEVWRAKSYKWNGTKHSSLPNTARGQQG